MALIEKIAGVEVVRLDRAEPEDLKKIGFNFTKQEINKIRKMLKRNPTKVEMHIFSVEWSEHCSYKSSKPSLKKYLKTDAPYLVLGPGEDAGVVEIGEGWCLVSKHESHNHPSQVLPMEGAATGIGGIVRDINCMGARVVGVFDPLRFGTKKEVRWIVRGVIDGIWQYGNALGVPNLGGDVYFSSCFDDNCLVNAGAVGVVRKENVTRSITPEAGCDVIITGKPTDWSGFGGVTFASEILDEEKQEEKKGAVQIPDPFLKNILVRANEQVVKEARERGIKIGLKDLGGGGFATASSEMVYSGGVEIDLNSMPTAADVPPEVIACAETQERYILTVPSSFTQRVLQIYNDEWELGNVYEGARAAVIGKTRSDNRYVLTYNGLVVADLPSEFPEPFFFKRKAKKRKEALQEPDIQLSNEELGEVLKKIISSPNIASREPIYSYYDTEVQGNSVIRPGEGDASVINPIPGSKIGIATGIGGNPFYGRISPYWGGVTAVVESMRNVVSVGAFPWAFTDCLNFGNPEKPEVFYEFRESVRGIGDGARKIALRGHDIPITGGNVSFYNESAGGNAVYPSPTLACYGVLKDYSRAVTMRLKSSGNALVLLGKRKDELGGSEFYRQFNSLGKNVPKINFKKEKERQLSVLELIENDYAVSVHDISDGGLATAALEMCFQSPFGIKLSERKMKGREGMVFLFSESSGFLMEIRKEKLESVLDVLPKNDYEVVGEITNKQEFEFEGAFTLEKNELEKAWKEGLGKFIEE